MFVAIAGIDGSGKSTLVKNLASGIVLRGTPVRVTYEPGGTNLGRAIRSLLLTAAQNHHHTVGMQAGDTGKVATYDTDSAWFAEKPEPLAELLLFAAARAQHCVQIRDWLRAGETVITDRFSICTRAYQGACGLRDELIRQVEKISTGGLQPDITILLDIPVDTAMQRLFWRDKNPDRFEAESSEYFARVRSIYLDIARNNPKVHVIDATRDRDEVLAEALQVIIDLEEQQRRTQMRVGRPRYKRDLVLQAYEKLDAEGKVIMPSDISRLTAEMFGEDKKVGPITVRNTLRELGLWTEERAKAMRAERTHRINESKREHGYPSLQKQRLEGYPNLMKARKVLHESKGASDGEAIANER